MLSGSTGLLLPCCKNILPYCKDKNSFSLLALGCLTGILAAKYVNQHFNQKEEENCKLSAQKLSGQKPVDYKYKWAFRRLDYFKGEKDGKSYIFNIAAIKPVIPEM